QGWDAGVVQGRTEATHAVDELARPPVTLTAHSTRRYITSRTMASRPREVPLLGRALLGLLQQGESSGYDRRRTFTQTPMGTFSDSPGAIYPALARLEADGLIQGRNERSAGLRRRRIFRLTPAGVSALEGWLSAPATREDIVRGTDEVMLRFSFIETTLGEA